MHMQLHASSADRRAAACESQQSPCLAPLAAPAQVEFFNPVEYEGEFTGSQQPVDSAGPGGSRKRRDHEQSRDDRARRRHERRGLEAGEESDGEEEVREVLSAGTTYVAAESHVVEGQAAGT